MKRYLIVVALFLTTILLNGCKQETISYTPFISSNHSMPSHEPSVDQILFKTYTDHVAPNLEVIHLT